MMKKTFFASMAAALALAVFMTPCQSLAVEGATAYGEASIGYNSLAFSRTDLSWLDPFGLDTRGSKSGVSVAMGGIMDPYHTNTIDGAPWGDTSMTPPESAHNFSTPADTVEGRAYTNLTNSTQAQLFSSANVALTHSSFVVPAGQTPLDLPYNGIGSVDLAEALFGGLFTVPIDGLLQITASYSLFYNLGLLPVTGSGAFANAYVDAGLALYDFNADADATGQQPLLASGLDLALGIQPFLSGAINGPGPGSGTYSSSGFLTLAYNLVALDPRDPTGATPMVYDFEAFVTSKSAASVPEPGTLILLVSGILGLAAFRRKLL